MDEDTIILDDELVDMDMEDEEEGGGSDDKDDEEEGEE